MAKASPSQENKLVARYTAAAFGGKPKVVEHVHDSEPLSVDVLECADRPQDGVTAYATIGLSDYPMYDDDGSEFPTRVEFVGACASDRDLFPNVLATAAFIVMRTNRLVYPGAVIPDCVSEYYKRATVPHLFFAAPFLWDEDLQTHKFGKKTVTWLLGVPITDAEGEFLVKNGDEALEALFEREQIDIFDLRRRSVV